MSEWRQFKVGDPSTQPDWENTECMPFTKVMHTSHIEPAIRIISDEEIRPSLVFDKSKLNTQRILVSWMSPNFWHNGFRYGNICFYFDFNSVIQDRNYYWVEDISYNTRACRILITDVKHDLPVYDPTAKDGPWWRDTRTGKNYYNSNYCLEFMVEGSVPLDSLHDFGFVSHHPHYCSVYRDTPSRCAERGLDANRGGALFLARAAVTGTDLSTMLSILPGDRRAVPSSIRSAFGGLMLGLAGRIDDQSGSITHGTSEGVALGRAAMAAYTFHRLQEARLLAAQFQSYADLQQTVGAILTEVTSIDGWLVE